MVQYEEIGIVLSGGGVHGAAHASLLKVLEENRIEPTQISGSSAGAMVGALYAAGYKSEDILEFFKMNTNIFRWKHSGSLHKFPLCDFVFASLELWNMAFLIQKK